MKDIRFLSRLIKNIGSVRTLPVLLFFFAMLPLTAMTQPVTVTNMRTEYLNNPDGIDMPHPRFSWVLNSDQRGTAQAGYQIIVTTIPGATSVTPDTLWNTHIVKSDRSVNIAYDGKTLQSDHTYHWKVRVWNQKGLSGPWSSSASFHTGLLKKSDWQGVWIGSPDSTISAPLLRKEFDIHKKILDAHVFISGLGYYELYLNGEKVGNHKLDPGTTDYNKRALYVAYDVTKYLNEGGNAVGVWLGNGYFRMSRKRPFKFYGHRPQVIMQLNIKYEDGTESHIVTNTSWMTSDSPIRANSVYDGEIFDARREQPGWDKAGFNDSRWKKALQVIVPRQRILSAQLMPPIRVIKTIYPINMREPEPGIYVFDFGKNLTGWPELFVDGGEGQKVVMKTGEVTRKDMVQIEGKSMTGVVDTIDDSPNRSAKARDIYILRGTPGTEVYTPRFTYHGFRYVELEGYPGKPTMTSVAVQVAHTDVRRVGEFSSSNALFNRIHQNTVEGQLSNLFSMPTDCPQRDERMGWMGDAHLSAEEAMHNFDMAAFYTNWLNLIEDEQNPDGSVPDIVPDHKWLPGTKIGTPAWQVAYPLITWYMHWYYGDTRVISDHYASLKKWMDYMASISDHYIITKGRGDWVPPERSGDPGDGSISITSTGYYYLCAGLMSKMAGILGKTEDQKMYVKLADRIREAFNKRFWNANKKYYGDGSQTSNAFPLYIGIVPDANKMATLSSVVNDIVINHNFHLWTGIIGVKALIEALPEYHESRILYAVANQTTYPGWGYMVSKGATTLWERWGGYRYFNAGMNSLNHIMFGSIDEFFYKDIAGINIAQAGYKRILIKPELLDKMTHARASVITVRGKVSSDWHKTGNEVSLTVTIPANSRAQVAVPESDIEGPYHITESGLTVWNDGKYLPASDGIYGAKEHNGYIYFEVGSGNYHFVLTGEKRSE